MRYPIPKGDPTLPDQLSPQAAWILLALLAPAQEGCVVEAELERAGLLLLPRLLARGRGHGGRVLAVAASLLLRRLLLSARRGPAVTADVRALQALFDLMDVRLLGLWNFGRCLVLLRLAGGGVVGVVAIDAIVDLVVVVVVVVVVVDLVEGVERGETGATGAPVALLEVLAALALLLLAVHGVTDVEDLAKVDGCGRTEVHAACRSGRL